MTLSAPIFQARNLNSPQSDSGELENRPKTLVIFAIVVAILFWASAFPAIRVALKAYTPTELAFLRYVTASVTLIIYALIKRMPLPRGRDIPVIAFLGFIGFTVYNIMLNAGEMTVSAGIASFIISSEIGIISLLASLFYNEQLNFKGWLGVLLCMIGVGIIAFSKDGTLKFSSGTILVFLATISISIYSVVQKPLLRRYSAVQFTTYAILAGTFFLFFFAPQAILSISKVDLNTNLAVIYMGIFPGAIAYIAWSYVLAQIPAFQAGSYLSLIPFVALIIAWLWLGEIPTLIALCGGIVIFWGVFLVNRRS
ncbi:MAG: EamA family transporter [Pleurocapsa sp. MO_192.B19]|nr:EamA family transporter [Pleurocapsa sp. MO_192.B19]